MNDATEEVIDEVETPEAEAEAVETEDVAETEQASQEDEPSESSAEKKDDTDKVQQRIDEITRIRREEERARIRAEQENEALRQQLEQLKPKAKPGMTLEDFDYDTEKFTDYVREQQIEAAREEARREAQEAEARERRTEFSVKESGFASEHPDYFNAVRNPNLDITQPMLDVAMGSDEGPAILYHLAQNPEVSSRLARMQPWDMAREIGRIEATALTKEVSLSEAPPPPAKIKAAAKPQTIAASSAESDKLSTEEWLARRQKELAKKRA